MRRSTGTARFHLLAGLVSVAICAGGCGASGGATDSGRGGKGGAAGSRDGAAGAAGEVGRGGTGPTGGSGAGGTGGAATGGSEPGTGGGPGGASAGTGGVAGHNTGAGGGGGMPGGGGMSGAGARAMAGAGGTNTGPTGTPVVLSDDAGYCWFQQPRVLFYGTRMIVASVSSGWSDSSLHGNPRALVYDFSTGKTTAIDLHSKLEVDDHDAPAFMIRGDGRILAVYQKHDEENHFYYRISDASDGLTWGAESTFSPSASSSLTYANVFRLPGESNRVYDFFRGIDGTFKPSYATSDDDGQTWKRGNVVIDFTSGSTLQRPYVRYASNGTDTVHFIYTEAHPRDYDTSIYHITYKGGSLYASDGTLLAPLTKGITATQGTRIYKADANHVAWGSDIVLDSAGRPVVTYSVQMNSAGLPVGQGGEDIRYRYARWDGTAWRDYALSYAGSKLYSGEDDYSGLATIDPDDPSVVYLSTNANPVTGAPLMSAADAKRHWEVFQAVTADQGATWAFTPITHDSTEDNLRPLLPRSIDGHQKALIWLRGVYRKYTDYQQQMVALFWRR